MRGNITACRSCGSNNLKVFLDLGDMPLADRLLTPAQLAETEPTFPLEVAFCEECGLVQITETVDPTLLFATDYPYFSSFSDHLLRHSRENVLSLIESRNLGPDSLVIEIASNDGYLLKNYVEKGIPVLGIDPAEGPVKAAREQGVHSMLAFFGRDLATELAAQGKKADVIHGNNVLAHVADTNGIVAGIAALLKDDGITSIEVPYVRPLIDENEFDTIYHEHLCYFSVTALDNLFRRHGLYINDIAELDIHGGSLRVHAQKFEDRKEGFTRLIEAERRDGVDRFDYYRDFGDRVILTREKLQTLLTELKGQGQRIAGYGAAAKGATLINYVGIGPETVEYVCDRNHHKQGRFMPGRHIPITKPERLMEDKPDYVLLLPWNFAEEILSQQQSFRDQGGRFIIPIPEPKVV
ncbi:MAG: class I SAM-dependent methyltransferase [Alphaproteobacteria bacterium]